MGLKTARSYVLDRPKADQKSCFTGGHGADVVIYTVGTAEAFGEGLGYVRNSGTDVEAGNFVDSGTIPLNPRTQLLEKGIAIMGASTTRRSTISGLSRSSPSSPSTPSRRSPRPSWPWSTKAGRGSDDVNRKNKGQRQ